MEKSDRAPHQHKFKNTSIHNVPQPPKISDKLVKEILIFLRNSNALLYTTQSDKYEIIKRIYNLVDHIIEEMSDYVVCRKGCAWCCAIPVEVLPVEIEYIEATTDLKRRKPLNNYIVDQEKAHFLGYCPLLDQETATCTAYESRPFNCRAFVVYDSPDYCRRGCEGDEIQHWTNGGPANGYGSDALLNLMMSLIQIQTGHKLTLKSRDEIEQVAKDIRCYF